VALLGSITKYVLPASFRLVIRSKPEEERLDVFGNVEVKVGGVVSVDTGSTLLEVFCGCGDERTIKSFKLLLLSWPFPKSSSIPPTPILVAFDVAFAFLSIEVVLEGAALAAPSKPFAVAPKPTKSIIAVPVGLLPDNAVVVLQSATFPAVPDIAIVPIASGVGRLVVPPVP
jgi:hypothetical protein